MQMSILFVLLGFLLQTPAPAASSQPAAGNPVVVIDTSAGAVTLELFKDRAPVSVENFLQYVRDGFYPGTIFHRVVPGYVIQGGGYTAALVEKDTRAPIQNEATNGLKNRRGTLAMARKRALRSGTSQFYINLADNASLACRRTISATRCSAACSRGWTSWTRSPPDQPPRATAWRTSRSRRSSSRT